MGETGKAGCHCSMVAEDTLQFITKRTIDAVDNLSLAVHEINAIEVAPINIYIEHLCLVGAIPALYLYPHATSSFIIKVDDTRTRNRCKLMPSGSKGGD